MKILGVNEGHHASACLLIDGEVVACISEERLTRKKNDCGWPSRAIQYCLAFGKIGPQELDQVGIATLTLNPVEVKIKRSHTYKIRDYLVENERIWKPLLVEKRQVDTYEVFKELEVFGQDQGLPYDFSFLEECVDAGQRLERFKVERRRNAQAQLGIPAERIVFLDHHVCHAAYAYFSSPIRERAVVITADGWGDGANGSIGIAEGNKLEIVHRTDRNDLARIYRWTTLLLGMKPNEHEFKVMGLAPYAKEPILAGPYEIYKRTLAVDGIDFKYREKPTDMYYWFKERFEGCRFDGIAGGLQRFTEELMCEWVANIVRQFQAAKVVMSGGLSLNVKANMKLGELEGLEQLWVPPGAGDMSLSLGAAYQLAASRNAAAAAPIKGFAHAYLGVEYGNDEVRRAIEQRRIAARYSVVEGVDHRTVARHLAEGKVVARLCGRMEFGERALGNRSILANPRNHQVVQLINEKIKNRDFWMPFAPSILAECAPDYLVNPKNLPAPFMTVAFESTPLAHEHLAAALHPYDKTVRPQLVSAAANPEYHALIDSFRQSTGIGALLNTSFNLHGEPIVCSPEDGLHTFENSDLDMLLMNDILVARR